MNARITEPSDWKIWFLRSSTLPASILDPKPPETFG
jgi:hypothetical protein